MFISGGLGQHIIVTWETGLGLPARIQLSLGRQAWDREVAYDCHLGGRPGTARSHMTVTWETSLGPRARI